MNTTDLHIPSNKVRDIERYILTELAAIYPEAELRQMTRMLFEAFLGWSTTEFLLHRDGTINQSDLLKFHWAVEDLRRQRPIQHIIGYTDFCDCRIEVSPDVLIPRPETEEIVQDLPHNEGPILDLCTGSGCIAIALSRKNPSAEVLGIDISLPALDIAQRNNAANQTSVQFCQGDVLGTLPDTVANRTYSLIISNPPYVMRSEAAQMERNVLDYEPGLALWVDDNDPLLFYRAITRFAVSHLQQGGLLVFEINQHLSQETALLMEQHGFECGIHTDFRGSPRSIIGTKK